MPLLQIQHIADDTLLGLWSMDECAEELARQYPMLSEVYAEACQRFKYEGKRRERMSVRALMVEMNDGALPEVSYNESGKPLLTDGRHISISHTKGIVAVVISEHHPVGVDVEYNSDRVSRVAKRFVREDEWTEDVKSLLIMWSAKETVYKLFSEDSLWYDEMRVVPFQVLAEGNLEVENLKRENSVQVYYQINKEYVLTYSIL